jgi:hypothetical protein
VQCAGARCKRGWRIGLVERHVQGLRLQRKSGNAGLCSRDLIGLGLHRHIQQQYAEDACRKNGCQRGSERRVTHRP